MMPMTWEELASCQQAMAQELMATQDPRFARGVCGHAYYAAYALVTARLPQSMAFGRGWHNPEHAKLPAHVNHIAGLGESARRTVRQALRRLRQRREDSDYRPGITVDQATARECLRDATTVFSHLNRS